jgi:hypothetical protein
MRDLLDTPYFRVALDRARSLVVVTRKSTVFRSVIECDRAYADVVRTLNALNRPKLRVLINLTDGPSTHDPVFEKVISVHRKKIYAGFMKAAAVVRTAAGMLQVSRHARNDALSLAVFHAEADAERYLLAPAPQPP